MIAGRMDRRGVLRGGTMTALGAGLAGLPFGLSPAAAQGKSWPSVEAFVRSYVDPVKVANMLVILGGGSTPAVVIAKGADTLGGRRPADENSLYRIYSMTKPITGMAAMILM
ncbi:MAG: serine hydrolase, partial [Planctomycetes bacterium]|nr:serine hydrolase [Planctomycetota bacterium]